MLIKKYYTFKDPTTNADTKDIGWILSYTNYQSSFKQIGSILYCIKTTIVPFEQIVVPRYPDIVEVDEATYNAAPTEGESAKVTKARVSKLQSYETINSTNHDQLAENINQKVPNFLALVAAAQNDPNKTATYEIPNA